MPTKNSTTTQDQTTAQDNGSNDEQINDDTRFTLTRRMGDREVSQEETTLSQELEKAGAQAAGGLIEEMIMRRRIAIEINLRGLVDIIVQELDKHGLPINETARESFTAGANGKVLSLLNPQLMKFYDSALQELDELVEINKVEHEPVSESNTYESWRKRL